MSEQRNAAYYADRARAEREAAEAATDARARAIHAELVARYEALAGNPSLELPPPSAANWSRSGTMTTC